MMFKRNKLIPAFFLIAILIGCGSNGNESTGSVEVKENIESKLNTKEKFQSIKEWETGKTEFRIYFMRYHGKRPSAERILEIANKWSPINQKLFVLAANIKDSDVRVSFYGKTSSKLAAEASDYRGVTTMEMNCLSGRTHISSVNEANILHEFGHVLGLVHGHQLKSSPIIRLKKEFLKGLELNKDDAWIEKNYLTKYWPMHAVVQEYDDSSIMNYTIPQSDVYLGLGTRKNLKLSMLDLQFVARLYSQNPKM